MTHPILRASQQGNAKAIVNLIGDKNTVEDVDEKDPETGSTALHYIVHCHPLTTDHVEAAKKLLRCGAEANAVNNNGETPGHLVCRGKNYDQDLQLLELDANNKVDESDANTDGGESGTGSASTSNKGKGKKKKTTCLAKAPRNPPVNEHVLAIVSALFQHKANFNLKDRDGRTPLHNAAEVCSLEVVTALLGYRADKNAYAKNKMGVKEFAMNYQSQEDVRNHFARIKVKRRGDRGCLCN